MTEYYLVWSDVRDQTTDCEIWTTPAGAASAAGRMADSLLEDGYDFDPEEDIRIQRLGSRVRFKLTRSKTQVEIIS